MMSIFSKRVLVTALAVLALVTEAYSLPQDPVMLPLPAQYRELKYIACDANDTSVQTGTHQGDVKFYINTGVIPRGDWTVDAAFTPTSLDGNRCLFCSRTSSSADRFTVYLNVSGKVRFDYQSNGYQVAGLTAGRRYRFTVEGRDFSIDGVNVTNATLATTSDFTAGTWGLMLFSSYENVTTKNLLHGAIGRLHYVNIWDGAGKAVRLFTPCRRLSDGAVGLYDRVGGKFYGNDGYGGEFTAGPDAHEPAAAVDPIRYASWNLGHFSWGKAESSTISAADLAEYRAGYEALIGGIGAQWFGVCEYAKWLDKDGTVPADVLFEDYSFRVLGPKNGFQWNGVYGGGRFELLGSVTNAFKSHVQNTYFLANKVRIDGTNTSWFVQVHLDWQDPAVRAAQCRELVDVFGREDRVVISGDFNTSIADEDGTKRTSWEDFRIFADAGFNLANTAGPCTSKSDNPKYVLDQVVARGFVLSDMQVYNSPEVAKLSDHNAISCVLTAVPDERDGREVVPVPSAPPPAYWTGEAQTPSVARDDRYEVACDREARDAGEYSVTVSLKDPEKTVWSDGSSADRIFVFRILPKANMWLTEPGLSSTAWPWKTAPTVTPGTAYYGTPSANYSAEELAALPPGRYEYVVTVAATDNYAGLSKSIPFAVTDAVDAELIKRKSGLPVAANLAFPPSDLSVRKLFVAYGTADGGEGTNGWEHVVFLSDVDKGVSEFRNLALPPVPASTKSMRFFVLSAFDSTSYAAPESLLAQWDGIENDGRAVHNAAPEGWRELVSGNLEDSRTGSPVFGRNSVAFSGAISAGDSFLYTVSGLKEAVNGRSATVQMMVKVSDDSKSATTANVYFYHSGSTTVGDSSKRPLALYGQKSSANTFDRLPFLGTSSASGQPNVPANDYSGQDVLATVIVDENGAHLFADDAETPLHTNEGAGTPASANAFYIGRMGGNYGCMSVYAVRIYGKALTHEEVVQNLLVDRVRFLEKQTCSASLPLDVKRTLVILFH